MERIKYLMLDVDGTLTDGKIYMGNEGELCKAFDVRDGYGIHSILIPSGIIPVIITGRYSKIVENRCNELGITMVFQGVEDKIKIVDKVLDGVSNKYTYANVAYMGDDINDLPAMRYIKESGGIVGCPNDAIDQVKMIADFVSEKNGGNGAVREFIDWIEYQ